MGNSVAGTCLNVRRENTNQNRRGASIPASANSICCIATVVYQPLLSRRRPPDFISVTTRLSKRPTASVQVVKYCASSKSPQNTNHRLDILSKPARMPLLPTPATQTPPIGNQRSPLPHALSLRVCIQPPAASPHPSCSLSPSFCCIRQSHWDVMRLSAGPVQICREELRTCSGLA